MRKTFYFILVIFLCSTTLTHAGLLDNVMKGIGTSSQGETDNSTIAAGLKEALEKHMIRSMLRSSPLFQQQRNYLSLKSTLLFLSFSFFSGSRDFGSTKNTLSAVTCPDFNM
jgi:hypothetical protein